MIKIYKIFLVIVCTLMIQNTNSLNKYVLMGAGLTCGAISFAIGALDLCKLGVLGVQESMLHDRFAWITGISTAQREVIKKNINQLKSEYNLASAGFKLVNGIIIIRLCNELLNINKQLNIKK